MLTDAERNALLIEVNREIEEQADRLARGLAQGGELPTLIYPPNGGFTEPEQEAVLGLLVSEEAVSGLRKLVANACAGPLSWLFALLDGIADPEGYDGHWPPFEICHSDNGEVLNEL
jgi:hypothetical protein